MEPKAKQMRLETRPRSSATKSTLLDSQSKTHFQLLALYESIEERISDMQKGRKATVLAFFSLLMNLMIH